MIKNVAREFHWPPDLIGGFFVDNIDLYGLIYWNDDCEDSAKRIKGKGKK